MKKFVVNLEPWDACLHSGDLNKSAPSTMIVITGHKMTRAENGVGHHCNDHARIIFVDGVRIEFDEDILEIREVVIA